MLRHNRLLTEGNFAGDNSLMSTSVLKPGECFIRFVQVKLLDLGMDQQTGDVRHDLQEVAIRDDGNSFDLPMVLGDEFQMRHKRFESVQPGNVSVRMISSVGGFGDEFWNCSANFAKSSSLRGPSTVTNRMFRSFKRSK